MSTVVLLKELNSKILKIKQKSLTSNQNTLCICTIDIHNIIHAFALKILLDSSEFIVLMLIKYVYHFQILQIKFWRKSSQANYVRTDLTNSYDIIFMTVCTLKFYLTVNKFFALCPYWYLVLVYGIHILYSIHMYM